MQILDKISIQRELNKININFNPQIIQEVHCFLTRYIGPLTYQDAQYHIPAACAIICETLKILTIDKSSFTTTGIKIQNVMRHTASLSKEKFLDTIQEQLKKSDAEKHYLIEKVIHIKIAFRVFKKYKAIFGKLATKAKIPMANIEELQAFFWIIYLIVQHTLDALENLNLRTKILTVLLQEIFCRYFGEENKQEIRKYVSSKDNFPELPQITVEEDSAIRTQIYQQVSCTFKKRDASASPNHKTLITHLPLLTRLVDDLSTKYQKLYLSLPQGKFIDEITFLQLTKNITPQAFNFKNMSQQITKVINFDNGSDDSDQMDEEIMKTECKKPKYPQIQSYQNSPATDLFGNAILHSKNIQGVGTKNSKSLIDYTPVSLGSTKNAWANQFLSNYSISVEQQMRTYFQKRGVSYDEFAIHQKQKISDKVQFLNRYNTKKEKSIVETLKMFLFFAYQLLSHNPNYDILSETIINALLCVSSHLYNWATKQMSLELQKYCQAYQSDLLNCLTVIYDIYKNVRLPYIIKEHLSERQKQVLIKELWDTDRGYLLLLEGKNSSNEMIYNRLNNVIYERIKQICDANKVNLTEVKKIQALLKEIMVKKPSMLQRNKLDQIIICSISACLNLNDAKYNLALSTIFKEYNSVSLSFHYNREMISANKTEDAPMSMLEFYNRIFIHEVQDMMSKEQNPKYLYTPIRQNHLRKLTGCMYSVSRLASGQNTRSVLGGDGGLNSYRKQILQKMMSSQRIQLNQDECESPYFGTNSQSEDKNALSLKRKITFGEQEKH